MAKTMEDWFLRGGERPSADDTHDGEFPPDSPHESDACDMCDGHHHCDECPHLTDGDDDEEEVLQDWIVTVTRTKTVDQYIKVRVPAKDEDTAEEIAMNVAETEADANWSNDEDTVDYCDFGIEDAEVAG